MAPFSRSVPNDLTLSLALSRLFMNPSQGNNAASSLVPAGVVHSIQPVESFKTGSQDAPSVIIPHTCSSLAETKDAESDVSHSRSERTAVTENSTPIDDDSCDRLFQYCLSYPWVAGCQHAEEFVKAQKAKAHLIELEKRKGGKGGGGGGSSGWPAFAVDYNAGEKIGLVIGFGTAVCVGLVLTMFGIAYCRECYKERSKRKMNERMTAQPQPWLAPSPPTNAIPLSTTMTPDHATNVDKQINGVRPVYHDPWGNPSDTPLPSYGRAYSPHVWAPDQTDIYGRPL